MGNNTLVAPPGNEAENLILDDRIKGLSYFEIEKKHGIPALEAQQLVRQALERKPQQDPNEWREILDLRMERIVEKLMHELDKGGVDTFKNADSIVRATERLAALLDLDQQTIKHNVTIVTDELTVKFFDTMRLIYASLHTRIDSLPLSAEARLQLEEWDTWIAEDTTEAIEVALYKEES